MNITVHLMDVAHIEPAMVRLGIFAKALEEADAPLESVRLLFKPLGFVPMGAVVRCREDVLKSLDLGSGTAESALYRRLLTASIVSLVR